MDKFLWRRRQLLLYFGLGVVGTIGTSACTNSSLSKTSTSDPIPSPSSAHSLPISSKVVANVPTGRPLPEFQGISQWLNSGPIKAADLKGSVALIQIWTFACINCQRTLPYITRWHRQYEAKGLKVVGVHTPELPFEREVNNIKNALKEHEITYPVAVDNDFKTWNAYHNSFWPHLFLADRNGMLLYDHIGEGAYDETEHRIQQLLG